MLANSIISFKEKNKTFDYADFICYANERPELESVIKEITTYQELMQVCGYLENDEIIVTNTRNKLEKILGLANGLNIQETNYLIKQLNEAKIKIEK